MGTAVAQWLRCCATNREVTGLIPAGVTGIFYWHKILPIALWPWGRLRIFGYHITVGQLMCGTNTNFFLAVLAILQPANTDSRLPSSFLYPHLQCHAFAVIHCGVGAWRVKMCLRTSSRKLKHGLSLSGMLSFFLLNSVTVSPQHMENFSRPLEMMQCQENKPFARTKCFLKTESSLKMSSTADDHQQNGQVTTQHE